MTVKPFDAAAALRALGWKVKDGPSLKRALEDFQRGWHLGPALLVDGRLGPRTKSALQMSLHERRQGRPDASRSYSFREFACKCGGRSKGCRVIRVHRALIAGLEEYRDALGRPVTIVSGYRCPARNQAVGGASQSQHVYGAAADLDYALKDVVVARLRAFAGIGRSKRTKLVRHVDVRHLSGANTTAGTPDRPTRWDYAS